MTLIPETSARNEPRSFAARLSGGPPTWAAAILLAIAIGVVYHHALAVPFIFDDIIGIEKNPSIFSLWPLIGSTNHPGPLNPAPDIPSSGRPLVNLSLALNYAICGDKPAGYHIFNLVIHWLAALLLLVIVRRTLRLPYFAGRFESVAGWLALAVALVWVLHPLQTESVVYVTQRTELMMALFYLATLYFSLRYWSAEGHRFQRAIWLIVAVVACLAGMASKEVMVSAPLMVLLFERTFIAGSLAKAVRRSWPLYAALAATWLLLFALNIGAPRGKSAGFGLGPSLTVWWMTQSQMLLIYLKLVVWPAPLLIHYQLPYLETFGAAWIYVVPVVLLGCATLVLLWRNSPLGYLGCFVFAILAPTSAVPVLTEMGAERRMYLPLAAIVVLFVMGIYKLVQAVQQKTSDIHNFSANRRVIVVTAIPIALLALIFGFVSVNRITDYDDQLGLWTKVLHYQPDNYVAHLSSGLLLVNAGKKSEAIESLHRAVALKPDNAVVLNNLGLALQMAGRPEEAVTTLQSAVEMEPDFVAAFNNLALSLADLRRLPEAIDNLKHALRLKPDDADGHRNLANALSRAGRMSEAIAEFEAAIALKGDDPSYHNNLAGTLIQVGRYQEAVHHCQESLRLRPKFFEAHHTLGTALLHAGALPQAIEELRATVAMKPDDATALNTLGAALLQTGQNPEALTQLQRAVELKPDYAVAHNNLGQALARTGHLPQAIEHFRLATEQDPTFSGAQISWALLLSGQGNFKESIEHFQKAIQLGADTPDMHNNLGDSYRKSGDTTRAIEQYEIAVRLNPSFMLGYANLAQTLALVDRSKDALAVSEKAMEVARSTGQQEALEQFEEWLKHYQTELRRAAEAASLPQSPKSRE